VLQQRILDQSQMIQCWGIVSLDPILRERRSAMLSAHALGQLYLADDESWINSPLGVNAQLLTEGEDAQVQRITGIHNACPDCYTIRGHHHACPSLDDNLTF
jgi:hypothetical protein